MKHIPAEFEQTKELFIFKCINCNVKLGSFIEFAIVHDTLNLYNNMHNYRYALKFGNHTILDLADDNCPLTCNQALIKDIILMANLTDTNFTIILDLATMTKMCRPRIRVIKTTIDSFKLRHVITTKTNVYSNITGKYNNFLAAHWGQKL